MQVDVSRWTPTRPHGDGYGHRPLREHCASEHVAAINTFEAVAGCLLSPTPASSASAGET
jgi:hypothetical protein